MTVSRLHDALARIILYRIHLLHIPYIAQTHSSEDLHTMTLLLFVILAFPLFLLFLYRKHRKNGGLLPPGPPGLPFIGNLHQMDNSAPHRYLWQLSKQYGPLMSLRLGFVPTIVVSSAKIAKEVMKTQDLEFASRPSLIGQQRLSYNGLDLAFSPYNDYWREMREICVLHLFTLKRVKSYTSIREYEVSQMIEKISKLASASKLINLSEALMFLTSTIICRVAFGKRYEGEGCERSRFHGLLNDAQAMLGSFFFSDHFPLMGWLDKLTGLTARLEKTFREMDLFYQEIIEEHLKPDRKKQELEDITDVLIGLRKDNDFAIDITWDHIKGVLMVINLSLT